MKQVINIGAVANDGTGDPLRTAFTKANSNFSDLYTRTTFQLEDFGAVGDGTTDDTAAFQSALNAASVHGGCIRLGTGKSYLLTAGVTCSASYVEIQGGGGSRIFIAASFTTGDAITFDPGSDAVDLNGGIQGLHIENLEIRALAKRSGGAAIKTKWTHHAVIRNVSIPFTFFPGQDEEGNPTSIPDVAHYYGIWMEKESDCVLRDLEVSSLNHGIYISGGNPTGPDLGLYPYFHADGVVDACNIQTLGSGHTSGATVDAAAAGVYLDGDTGGVIVSNSNISGYPYGVFVAAGNREFMMLMTFLDSCGISGLKVVGAPGLNLLYIVGGWAAGNTTTGIDVTMNSSDPLQNLIEIVGFNSYVNGTDVLIDGASVQISGARIDGTASFGANCTDVSIAGGKVGTLTLDPAIQKISVSGVMGQGDITGFARVATATSYSVLKKDSFVAVTDTSSARTVTLPAANSIGASATRIRRVTVKDESGAAATHNITIARSSSDTIDGATSKTISTNYGSATYYTSGTNWFTLP